jgi:hypothetical protein
MAVGCLLAGVAAWGVAQGAPAAAPPAQLPGAYSSLGDELSRMAGHEVHIFFIHGIGADGPGSHDSRALRKSICSYLKDCLSPAGEQVGNYDYADRRHFAPDGPVPALKYMGKPVWTTAEEWRAAAPFAVHFKLARANGAAVFVDELNWWPLVMSLKCRQILAADARLAGPSRQRLKTCSTRGADPAVKGRFLSYDWVSPAEVQELLKLPRRSALVNRTLKNNLSDWGFADAVLALGPMHAWMVDGIRQLILKSVAASEATGTDAMAIFPAANQEFVIVTHSLGSYLIFSALNVDDVAVRAADGQLPARAYLQVLRQTSLVYFFANQVPLLELANLDESPQSEFAAHLEVWGKLHCEYERSLAGAAVPCQKPKIIALNDPSDLLTWRVPPLETVDVENLRVKNALHWFGLIEDPTRAHLNYSNDKQTIREMLWPSRAIEKKD